MRDTLHTKIDLDESKLKPYEGFIFLCGGPTDATASFPISIRDAIYRELAKDSSIEARIRVAEDYKDWAHESIYQDLVLFERHLAELSSVIVLVLESPGSIAELGLFSVISEYQQKLLVVIETDHYSSTSFIRLGPVDYLEKGHSNWAECHRWFIKNGSGSVFDEKAAHRLQPELADAVRTRIGKLTPERAFSRASWLDWALLICDLLGLCSALTIRELKGILDKFGYTKSEQELKQALFTLRSTGLIAMEPKGDQRFYVSVDSREFLRLHIVDPTFDRDRVQSDLLASYEKSDKKRFRVIQEVRRRNAHR